MASRGAPDIRAAGAVVWRVRKGLVEVALVHRPRYDDWSLPKGKLKHGERAVAAAVREIAEETGSRVELSRRLRTVRYDVAGARKEVTYWLARHRSGTFVAGDEVDKVTWLPLDAARRRVGYAADRQVLDETARLPLPESVIVLVRHARAGKRSAWKGADLDRPLDKGGRRQAEALTGFLRAFGVSRVVSAEPRRCTQTVAPFALAAGLQVGVDPALGDLGFDAAPEEAAAAVLRRARPGKVTVIASQGRAIPGVLEQICPKHRLPDTKKGHAWVLGLIDGEVAFADHYPDASLG